MTISKLSISNQGYNWNSQSNSQHALSALEPPSAIRCQVKSYKCQDVNFNLLKCTNNGKNETNEASKGVEKKHFNALTVFFGSLLPQFPFQSLLFVS